MDPSLGVGGWGKQALDQPDQGPRLDESFEEIRNRLESPMHQPTAKPDQGPDSADY